MKPQDSGPTSDPPVPPDHAAVVARELGVAVEQVQATVELLAGGATVPFISRYRKEATGSLDEVAVAAVRDRMSRLHELDKRPHAILASLAERGIFDDELRSTVVAAETLPALDELPDHDLTVRGAVSIGRRFQDPLAELVKLD